MLRDAIGIVEARTISTVYTPTGGNTAEPRAPLHRGGLWTCDHLAHSPTEGRGPLRRTQNHAHPFVVTERWTPKGAA